MTSAPDLTVEPALTPLERDHLAYQEGVIARGLTTFVEVGLAFAEIRRSRLYRESAPSFEDYCRTRWNLSDSRARQFILGALTALEVETVTSVTLPNEAVARALRGFDPPLQPVIAQTAQARYGKLTASNVGRVGRVIEELTRTGHVDTGSGESTPIEAALTAEDAEALKRQQDYIADRQKPRALVAVFQAAHLYDYNRAGIVAFQTDATADTDALKALADMRSALIVKVYRESNS